MSANHPEVVEYEQFEDEMRASLEQQYQYNMLIGDRVSAHEILKTLMEYRLIPESDPRTKTDTKVFGKDVNVKDSSNWGMLDYRRRENAGFIGKYMYSKLSEYKVFNVPTLPHWGKRVEGNYEGDIKITANTMKVRMSLMITSQQVKNAMEEIKAISDANKSNRMGNYEELRMLALRGVMRVYKLEVVGNIISKYRLLGFVMIKVNNSGNLVAVTIIKYEALYNSWVSIQHFMNELKNAIINSSSTPITVGNLFDPAESIRKQNEMIKIDTARDSEHKKLVAREAANKAAKEAKKATEQAAKEPKLASRKSVKRS